MRSNYDLVIFDLDGTLIDSRRDLAYSVNSPVVSWVCRCYPRIVGDSGVDIQTGLKAQVMTCGVTYDFSGDSLAAFRPHFLVTNLKELPPIVFGRKIGTTVPTSRTSLKTASPTLDLAGNRGRDLAPATAMLYS